MKIKDEHHVIRHIPSQRLLRDENGNIFDEDGKLYGVFPQAFEVRKKEVDEISVNWVEFFSKPTLEEGIQFTVQEMRKNPLRLIKKTQRCGFAVGQVQKIKSACKLKNNSRIRVVHTPTKDNKSHSSIKQISSPNEFMQILTDEVFLDIRFNSNIP